MAFPKQSTHVLHSLIHLARICDGYHNLRQINVSKESLGIGGNRLMTIRFGKLKSAFPGRIGSAGERNRRVEFREGSNPGL